MPVILEYDRYNGRRLLQKMGIGNIWFYDRASTPSPFTLISSLTSSERTYSLNS